MNKFKESLQIESFIREEQKKVKVNHRLSEEQKRQQLEALEMALEDYKYAERDRIAREVIRNRDEEQWFK